MKQPLHGQEIRIDRHHWRFEIDRDGEGTLNLSYRLYGGDYRVTVREETIPIPAHLLPTIISHLKRGVIELRLSKMQHS